MDFAAFDVFALVVLLVAGIRTAFKGFVAEFMSTLAILIGVGVAVIFTSKVTVMLIPHIGDTFWTPIAAFLLLFIVSYLVIKVLEATFHRLIDRIQLEKLDQTLGFVLGLVEGFLLLAVIVFLLQLQNFIAVEALFEESFMAGLFQKVIPIGTEYIEEQLQKADV